MKILVTSGGTRSPIDNVRMVTNISTGALGSIIADTACARGHEVIYVHGAGALIPAAESEMTLVKAEGVDDLKTVLVKHAPYVGAVIQAMAVSDFVVDKVSAGGGIVEEGKISSKHERLIVELVRSPKIIDLVKKISPQVCLVGFKLLDGASDAELILAAQAVIDRADCDFVLANDLNQIRTGEPHRGLLVAKDGSSKELSGKFAIASGIIDEVEKFYG